MRRRDYCSVPATPSKLIQNVVWLRACVFLSGCSVVNYLARQDFVDSDRIAVLEICGGGGYAAAATLRDHQVKALATVSMVDNGTSTRLGWCEIKDPSTMLESLEAVAPQFAAGTEVVYQLYLRNPVFGFVRPP